MATQVVVCEPFPLTENGENSSLNGCQLEVPEQPSEDEVPVSNDNEEDVKDSPVIDEFATTVEEGLVSDSATMVVQESPASDNAATMGMFVSEEAPVDHNVAPIVDEAPVSYLDKALVVHEDLPASSEGAADMSIVKVDEGSVSNSAAGNGTLSNNIVRVPPEKRTLYKFGQRTSNFRGVTRHRWTGKYEAHLWDNSTITEGRKRKGKQVYLGGYESEQKAAQAYDLAALKYWGASANTKLNFPISTYEKELDEMKDMSREEYVNSLRRKSICFTRGHSIYRGVTRQNEGRRWQARIGRVAGGKDIYLGTYDTEEEAAEAYDIAAVKLRGMNAITNFDICNYYKEGTKELDVIPIKSIEEESSHLKIRYFRLE